MLTQPSTAATGYGRQGLGSQQNAKGNTFHLCLPSRKRALGRDQRDFRSFSARRRAQNPSEHKAERRMCAPKLQILVGEQGCRLAEGWKRRRGGINISLFWTLVLFYSVTLLLHTRRTGPLPYQPHPSQRCPGLPTAITYKNFSGPPHVV